MTLLIAGSATIGAPASASALSPDVRQIIDREMWGTLLRDGGRTFFCNKVFHQHTVLVTESYIYPLSHVRRSLHCDTNLACEHRSANYRRIETDLHNIVPAEAVFELKQRNVRYGELAGKGQAGKCGVRNHQGVMEPPDRIKGDIARTIAYMHSAYGLPLLTPLKTLQKWNQLDPPDRAERARNRRIQSIQGTANPYVTEPWRLDQLAPAPDTAQQATPSNGTPGLKNADTVTVPAPSP